MTRDAWLWIAAAIGPLAWFGDLVISFAVSPGPHRAPDAPALLAISGAAFVLAALGAVIAWRTPAAAP
ncbi:MAG TPA: hypothetical protein VFP84_38160, partial [Kofleriaceae bacterium]|nr:hypothetical protein [Kofleriaceae bacterium]